MSSVRPVIFSIRRIGARGAGQQPGQVAGAVADHRHRLLGQRGEDQLALLAVGQHLAGHRVDDLGVEVVLPDVQPVLGLDALAAPRRGRSPRTGRRCRPRACRGAPPSRGASRRSTARRRRCRPERGRARVDALRARSSSTIASMYDGVTMMMSGSKSGISWTWRSVMPPETGTTVQPELLGAVVRAEPAGEQPVAVGVVQHVPRPPAGGPDATRHHVGPHVEVVARCSRRPSACRSYRSRRARAPPARAAPRTCRTGSCRAGRPWS